jgi:regulator of protease activity HflC (stomatin/prohibitin superfamily)
MSRRLKCKCGQLLLVEDEHAGKQVQCPYCNAVSLVPPLPAPVGPPQQQPAPIAAAPTSPGTIQMSRLPINHAIPSSARRRLQKVYTWLAIAWCAVAVFSALLAIESFALCLLFLMAGTGFLGWLAIGLLSARTRVLQEKDVPCLMGAAKMVAWDPTEGMLFLRDKAVAEVDDDLADSGGIRLIFPTLGEEVGFRAPLEIQTLSYTDHDVLTREYVPLEVQGTIYWRIVDLHRLYLLVSREIHKADERGERRVVRSGTPRQLAAAEQWLRSMAEEITRAEMSKVSTGLLVAESIVADLPSELRRELIPSDPGLPSSAAGYRTATDGLAAKLLQAIKPAVQEYGIEIHRIALQQVRLRPEIHQAAVAACATAYSPLQAQREAAGKKVILEAEADVIGKEALAAEKVVSHAPAWAVGDFINHWLATAALPKPPQPEDPNLPIKLE